MSERGNFRGGPRGGGRGGRGGGDRGGRGGGGAGAQTERKKENILDLTKYMDKEISVKFNGGREGMFWSMVDKVFLGSKFGSSLPECSDRHVKRLRPIDEPGPRQCQGDYKRHVATRTEGEPQQQVLPWLSLSTALAELLLTRYEQTTKATPPRAPSACSSREEPYSSSSPP